MKSPLHFAALCLAIFTAQAEPPASLAYVLQADSFAKPKAAAITKLADCGRDWIVLDAHYSSDEPWTAEDLATLRAGKAGRKVIAYLSIGEAEDYRVYWQSSWKTSPPAFLLGENPEWKGNYRVRYWHPAWQKIILAEVDKLMAAGFDGVYLDIVDGFETFEQDGKNYLDDRLNPETKQSFRRDMVDWVKVIAAHARKTNLDAVVIPQNGTQLFAHKDFLDTVDAAGVEDLFTNGNKLQKPAHVNYVCECLAPIMAAHKPVLDIEYARQKERQAQIRTLASKHGFIWLIADRQLKTLGESGTRP